ncbi:MAG: Rrf2 family transcriptional regulator [Lentisphaerota bacterium]
MKLTSKSEYALLALVYLARKKPEGYLSVDIIAKEQGIPSMFLEQILLIMKRAQYVASHKGQKGGYRLLKSPSEINLAQIIRLFDGALAPTESVSKYFYASTPIEKEKKIMKVFKNIRDHVANILENTTLADVV